MKAVHRNVKLWSRRYGIVLSCRIRLLGRLSDLMSPHEEDFSKLEAPKVFFVVTLQGRRSVDKLVG